MLHRQSSLFIPTLRDDPSDAEAISHKLLVRGGYIRQVGAGIWTFLPLGWKVHQNVVQIIREEIDAIGGQEMLCPVLTPFELWQQTGRDYIQEIFRLKDRNGRDFVLPLTHEETFSFHARELQSYRQLPQILYHFAVKQRDEPRPRGGLLRVREFIMKDSYSFDRDEEGLDVAFEAHRRAYERIFERCGIHAVGVEAESGMMGGSESFDFLAPSSSGENTLVTCENGDFAADLEVARGVPRAPEFPERLEAPEEVETPGATTIESAGRVPRDRSGRDVEGDAGYPCRRCRRARARAGRRPARAEQARRGDRPAVAAVDRRGDPRGVRCLGRLARPGRVQGRDHRRRSAPDWAVRRRRES